MNITTTVRGFDMTRAINNFAREQIETSLQRFNNSVMSVDVFMSDNNGPKGGIDKQVTIRAQLRNRNRISIEATHENLYAAIKNASKRMKRAVRRNHRKFQQVNRLSIRSFDSSGGMPATTGS